MYSIFKLYIMQIIRKKLIILDIIYYIEKYNYIDIYMYVEYLIDISGCTILCGIVTLPTVL